MKRVNLKTVSDNVSSTSTSVKNNDLFAKLDELEEQEIMNNELNDKVGTFEDSSGGVVGRKGAMGDASVKKTSTKKRVKWKEGFVMDGKDKETVAFPKDGKATIKFAHSREEVLAKE